MHSAFNIQKALGSWRRSKESFLKGIASLANIELIRIPYEQTTLTGYFLKTKNSKKKKPPLLIVHTGFDGTAEELYFGVGVAAMKRGYNCLIFEGPGQGAVIRMQKIPYRYDWEKVVTPVIDYALTRRDVSKRAIALMGISMGGYLAPRAAAFEPRIKACIANGGIFDLTESFYKPFPSEIIELLQSDPEQFNAAIEEIKKESTEIRWFFDNGMFTFDAASPAELMLKIKGYTLEGVAEKIKCQMLVIDSEADMFFSGQPQELYKALTCPKEYILFTRQQAAQAHCQMGATAISNEIIFNWLDKVFAKK
jgi:dienelactone hydrolase